MALVPGAGLQAATVSSTIPGFEAFLPVSMTVSPFWFSLVANLDASTAAFFAVLALAAVLRNVRRSLPPSGLTHRPAAMP